MELGDGMMSRNARILVIAVGLVVLGLGSGMAGPTNDAMIQVMAINSGPAGPEILLRSSGSMESDALETVHYSPQPGIWVIDMPRMNWPEDIAHLSDVAGGIQSADLTQIREFGREYSRLTVTLVDPLPMKVSSSGGELLLRFAQETPAAGVRAAASPAPLVTLPPVTASVAAPAVQEKSGVVSLTKVEVTRVDEGLLVNLSATGPVEAKILHIPAPERLVLDLNGVVDRVDSHSFPVSSADIRGLRLAQHQGYPYPITRMVVDMERPLSYSYEATDEGGLLRVGLDENAAVIPARTEPVVVENMTISNVGAGGKVESYGQLSAVVSDEDPVAVVESLRNPSENETPPAEFEPSAPAPNPWVADPHQLMEEASAAEELDMGQPADSYDSTEVETSEVQFTGDPITLTLKDADIKDVLKTFSALTHLNIVIDPEVRGTVTVELRDVPWDQALDLILRINGLDYVLENNVLRVSTVFKLTNEKKERSEFLHEQEKNLPLKTVVKPLSYAKAKEVKTLLSGDSCLMSTRGSVVVDARTNTLIIRDIVERVEGILKLIDTLDQPTPQVVIEGRIVETTKTFSRELGVQWSFNGVNDAAHANTTGLSFPSSISTRGGVNLDATESHAGFIGLSFGDILNTFNLDFLLSAAESEGTAKIVSTPRVTTQNLKRAKIRSGFQLPVQTIANNTITVVYIDATLNLEVTPQITAEGTVNLEISIKKQQPLPAGIITGGNNAPILTRDAKTELLVRDGGTTVIGGIYQIDTENNENRVPGLSKIPLLGALFRSRSRQIKHDELLIFITPRIVKY